MSDHDPPTVGRITQLWPEQCPDHSADEYCVWCNPPCSAIDCDRHSIVNATTRLYPRGQGGTGGVLVRVYLCAEHGGDAHEAP